MITNVDADFHLRDPADLTWTETTFLPFAVHEEGIFGNVYVLARPNVGAAISSIMVGKGICRQPYEVDFTDPQMHLRCPESFSRYHLENGLFVEALGGPRDYRITYENALKACSFELNFRGLHRPFDPHDSNENPLLAGGDQKVDPRLGKEWMNGHFEVKGHIKGELELRGKRYRIDCYDGMDHSWGPRPEIGVRAVAWVSLNFGDDLAFHIAVPLSLHRGEVNYDPLRFGFVVENGEVHGLVEASIQCEHIDMLPISNRVRCTDVRGKSWEFFGAAVSGHPWYSFNPCHVSFQCMMRYQDKHGRIGYGEIADIFGLDYLAERMSRHGRNR